MVLHYYISYYWITIIDALIHKQNVDVTAGGGEVNFKCLILLSRVGH